MTDGKNLASAERHARWMRLNMGLRDGLNEPPVAGSLAAAGRCDVHGVGYAKAANHARFAGFMVALVALVALMIGARPPDTRTPDGQQKPVVANTVAVGLGALSLGGFVAGRAIERRTRFHVWLQCEEKAVTNADVHGLLAAVDEVRGREDRLWTPDQVWIAGPEIRGEAASLARSRGVRCFVTKGNVTREVV